MKYVVYILTALLAAAVIVILLLGMLSYIDYEYDYLTKAFSEAYFWYSIAIYSINIMLRSPWEYWPLCS